MTAYSTIATVIIAGKTFNVAAAITDRKDMRYHMIVGMDILRDSGFLIDPAKGETRENGNARRSDRP